MDWQTNMTRAIDYIEENLDGEIEPQHWGAGECQVTTVDGSVLRFFEIE